MGFYAPAQIVRDAREHGVEVLPTDVNHSQWDNTLELTSCHSRVGGNPACNDSGSALDPHFREDDSKGRLDKHIALRLGFRQVDGLPEHAVARLITAREIVGPFKDVAELRDRAGLSPAHIERLASADCFTSLDLRRRQALWDARSLVAGPDLPLFRHTDQRDEGAEKVITRLPNMPLSEEVVADYQTIRLSLKAHPLSFLRPDLGERGFVRACDLRNRKFRSMVQVAGVVLIRQRPRLSQRGVFHHAGRRDGCGQSGDMARSDGETAPRNYGSAFDGGARASRT